MLKVGKYLIYDLTFTNFNFTFLKKKIVMLNNFNYMKYISNIIATTCAFIILLVTFFFCEIGTRAIL